MLGGGRGRGRVAQALLQLNISQFQRAAQAAIATSRTLSNGVQQNIQVINTALNQGAASGISKVAQGFREATRAANEFSRTDLGRVSRGLQDVERQFRGISIAAGLISAAGIREASNLQRQNALLKIFSRTQESLANNQAQISAYAESTSQSYLTTLEAANQILPTVNRYKIDLGQVLSIIQRLAILDPLQGTQGAAFAIREALSGQGRSLATRFELPLSQVNNLIDRAAGDPQKVIESLDQLVSQLGLTQDAFLDLQNSGINSLDRLGGTLREALGTAFMPALQKFIIPAADHLNELLQNLSKTNPALLEFAGMGALIVAGLTPVLVLLPQLINLFGTLATFIQGSTGQALVGLLKGGAAALAAPLAAVAGGVAIGGGVAQVMANSGSRSGDLGRIASKESGGGGENVFAVLWERIRQLMLITIREFGIVFGAIIASLQKLGAYLEFAFKNLDNVLALGGNLLQQAFSQLVIGIGDVLVSLASVLGAFGGTELNAIGEAIRIMGQAELNTAQSRQPEIMDNFRGEEALYQKLKRIDAGLENFTDEFTTTLLNFFGFGEALANQADEIARPLSPLAQIISQLSTAGNDLITVFRDAAPLLAEAATNEMKLNEELAITIQRRQEERDIEDERQAFDDILSDYRRVTDFRRQLARDDADFADKRLQDARDFAITLEDEDQDNFIRREDMLRDFYQDELQAAEEHGRRLERIERETREAVRKAALKLDATGVSEAYRNGRRQLEELNEQDTIERNQRKAAFEQSLADFDEQNSIERNRRIRDFELKRQDELIQYNIQRNDRIRDFERERQEELYDRQLRAYRRAQDREREDRIEQEDHQRRILELWNRVYAESQLWTNLRDVVEGASNNIRASIASIFAVDPYSLQTKSVGEPIGSAAGKSGKGFTNYSSIVKMSSLSKLSGYAMGGTPPLNQPVLVGERGVEVVQFTSPARIHSSESSVTRGMMNGGVGLQIGTFAPVFGIPNLESVAGELHRRIEQTILQFANEYSQYRGA